MTYLASSFEPLAWQYNQDGHVSVHMLLYACYTFDWNDEEDDRQWQSNLLLSVCQFRSESWYFCSERNNVCSKQSAFCDGRFLQHLRHICDLEARGFTRSFQSLNLLSRNLQPCGWTDKSSGICHLQSRGGPRIFHYCNSRSHDTRNRSWNAVVERFRNSKSAFTRTL